MKRSVGHHREASGMIEVSRLFDAGAGHETAIANHTYAGMNEDTLHECCYLSTDI